MDFYEEETGEAKCQSIKLNTSGFSSQALGSALRLSPGFMRVLLKVFGGKGCWQ